MCKGNGADRFKSEHYLFMAKHIARQTIGYGRTLLRHRFANTNHRYLKGETADGIDQRPRDGALI